MTDVQLRYTKEEVKRAVRTEDGRPAFMPFITAGFPTYDAGLDIALTLQEAGASVLEVGFPYSDPLADGPVIQQSSEAALRQGISLTETLRFISDLRERGLTIPVITFCYYNPILQYGLQRFIHDAQLAGANGMLVPDLPHEESKEVRQACAQKQFAYIPLVAPTSKERIRQIVTGAEGFLYCVSSLGVTGVREQLPAEIDSFLGEVKRHAAETPLAVGFGVSKREHVRQLSPHVDGIAIGSAIVKLVQDEENLLFDPIRRKESVGRIKSFVSSLFSGKES
jgi:tryptophan synthase alpha chain